MFLFLFCFVFLHFSLQSVRLDLLSLPCVGASPRLPPFLSQSWDKLLGLSVMLFFEAVRKRGRIVPAMYCCTLGRFFFIISIVVVVVVFLPSCFFIVRMGAGSARRSRYVCSRTRLYYSRCCTYCRAIRLSSSRQGCTLLQCGRDGGGTASCLA